MMSNKFNDRDDFIYENPRELIKLTDDLVDKYDLVEKFEYVISQLYTSADLDLEKLDDYIYEIAGELGLDMPKGKLNIKRRS